MAIKIYEDGSTKELVIERSSNDEVRFPAFSEIRRRKIGSDALEISTVSGVLLLEKNVFGNLTNSGGTPYASFAALKTALDPYFDAAV